MLTHHVLFWLKPDTTEDQKNAFRAALDTLQHIETVKSIHIGVPAPISRAVVDTSYTFSLLILFDSLNDHDTYQVHPLHKAFIEGYKDRFEKVVIYDAI